MQWDSRFELIKKDDFWLDQTNSEWVTSKFGLAAHRQYLEPALSIPLDKLRQHAEREILQDDRIRLVDRNVRYKFLLSDKLTVEEQSHPVSDWVPKILTAIDPLVTPETLQSAKWAIDTHFNEFLIYQDAK